MSCIPKILQLKSDKEFLIIPSNKGTIIEDVGHYKGYDYLITFRHLVFRCGYVALPPSHPTNNSNDDYPDYDVHGGITFFKENILSENFFGENSCKDKWIGFDGGHVDDGYDLGCLLKYFCKERKSLSSSGPVRTKEYMTKECKKLIDQLISKEKT